MPDMCKLLDEVEKKLYIQGLAYVLAVSYTHLTLPTNSLV